MEGPDDEVEFSDTRYRFTKAIGPGIAVLALAFLLQSMFRRTNSVVDIYIAVVFIAIVVFVVGVINSFRVGFYLSDRGLTARSIYSSKTWRWDEIKKADYLQRTPRPSPTVLGVGAISHRYSEPSVQYVPLIETTSGRTILLRGLTARVRDASGPTWVDLAIQAINSRVANRRG